MKTSMHLRQITTDIKKKKYLQKEEIIRLHSDPDSGCKTRETDMYIFLK